MADVLMRGEADGCRFTRANLEGADGKKAIIALIKNNKC